MMGDAGDRRFRVRPISLDDARSIAGWRYPGRLSTYDVGEVVTPERGFWSVVDGDDGLVGYACFGEEARVPGIVEARGHLDVGYGMRPDLVGQGLGRAFVSAILDFAVGHFEAQCFRLVILDWNGRSQAVARFLGFQAQNSIESTEGTFVVMTRSIADRLRREQGSGLR
jgi:ribosomal-protein-alanine N-acetyltransferase